MASTLEVDQIKHSSGVAFTLPQVDGSAGQVLQTNASRVLSFGDADPDSGKGSDIASAAPCVVPDGDLYYDVTGTTNFVAFTVTAGRWFILQFDGILTMTHHATNLDLPGEDDIITAAGDVAVFFATGTNTVQCVNYTRVSGKPVITDFVNADINASAAIATSKLSGAVTGIASHGLGALATLGSVDTGQITANAVDETKIKDAFVADFTEVTVASGDSLLLGDATDSGNTKRDTVQGVLDLVHDATIGLATMWIPACAMRPSSTDGCAAITSVETTALKPDMQVLDFDSSNKEHAQFSVAMPKSWNEGTVTAQFYWTHATAVATNVVWGIEGVCISDNDTIDAAYGTAVEVTDTFHNAAEDLAITAATGAITLAGTPAEGDLAFFQVYRDSETGADTTDSTDARLVGVKIFFTTNAENDD